MRLVYLGSPEVAVGPLRALVGAGHEVVLVVSQPDRKRGRGGALVPSPVKAAALELGLAVTDRIDDIIGADADDVPVGADADLGAGAELGVVVAFGRLVKPQVLAALPMVNVHFSLLPRWRGAAPVERAILAGDDVTGVCIMALEEGLDTGPVYARAERPIGPEETADELRSALADTGTAMLLHLLGAGLPEPVAQAGEATYAAKLDPAELEIDWGLPAEQVHRVIRLGRAWTTFRGQRLKIPRAHLAAADPSGLGPGAIDPASLAVGTADGAVCLVEVQPEGKAVQPAPAWRNGAHLAAGDRFG